MKEFLPFLQAIIGLFAVVGVWFTVRMILDAAVKRRSGLKMQITVISCKGDAEYAVRFAESRFVYGEYAGFFSGITLSEAVPIKSEAYERLRTEFPNLCLSAKPAQTAETENETE